LIEGLGAGNGVDGDVVVRPKHFSMLGKRKSIFEPLAHVIDSWFKK
jgi:hypothetical protein